MFSSSPLDKNCINSDSCSPGRNNAPNRFSVALSPLGDENQQIRIQLAVHKYNGTGSSSFNNRNSFISPVRHSFLKNSLKVRNYEGDTEGTSKTEKRNGNQYEGVGSFPTIHLKKSAVRYRPIKRFHDVKIPYPELPVNRFLSHLPEVCQDMKSSTRSVLDVLEDLSGNKIHSKDDCGSNKPKPRGLGGDYVFNPNSVYKPLFVQKPKLNTVLTRDNTTQTLSPVTVETSSPKSSSSQVRNGASDPKAELRRKLAKQNNEIFASLSSSISSAFSLKRKIDKVIPSKDDGQLNGGLAQKKAKFSNQYSQECNENGYKSVITKTVTNDSIKLSRKSKLSENSPVSPNKDRLTTIFLDTRNTSPKAQLFQANASTEMKSAEKSSQKTSNGLTDTNGEEKGASPLVNTSGGEKNKDESGRSSVSFGLSGDSANDVSEQQQSGLSNKPVLNLLTTTADTSSKDNTKLSSPDTQMGKTNSSNFISEKTPSAPYTSGICTNSAEKVESEKKENGNKEPSKPFVFGNSSNKPNFGSFKFGVDGSIPVAEAKPVAETPSAAVSAAESVTTSVSPQFSFGTTPKVTSAVPTSVLQFGVTSSENILTSSPPKTTFTFGQNTSPSQVSKDTSSEGKNETSNATSTSSTSSSQSIQPVTFTFGQKPVTSETAVNPVNQTSNAINFGASLNKSGISSSGTTFTFGQKAETSVTSTQEQTKTFPFTFGQKPNADPNNSQVESGQKGVSLFSVPKSATQEPSQGSSASTGATSTTQASSTAAPQSLFTQNSAVFGVKTEKSSLGSIPANAPSSTFPNKTLSFGSSVNGFGKTTSQATTGFTTSTSTASGFSFGASNTTQTIPTFGVASAPQSSYTSSTAQSVFGGTSAAQSASTFGTSTSLSASSYAASSTTQSQPTFGVSSASQPIPAFESSSNKQSLPSFGTTATTHSTPTFGASSQPTPSFGATSTTQTTFGLSSSQPTTAFGASTSTQSPIIFGASTTQKNTFGPSPGFSTATTQATINFGASPATSTPGFPSSQSFDSKPIASQTPSLFGQNPTPSFSSNTTFTSNQNNIFAPKPTTETPVFGENKIQTSGFGSSSQPFAPQNKFSFGMSTSNTTAFTTSPPNTTAPPVFSFGGTSTGNTFAFGSNPSTSNAHSSFAFKSPSSEPFKFGAAPTTATSSAATTTTATAFGGTVPSTFSFGSHMNNNPEQKPSFAFGSSQLAPSSSGFNFGTPSPSLFNFGGSTSSASSGSGFSFGTPTPGAPFGQTPSPGAPFAVPGTFNIGSGSSQSRPRASSRPRRRQ